jgi:hypothetical protein
MIRTFFAGLGVLFALLMVFCASFLGKLAFELKTQGPAYEKLAVDITRELSRAWSIEDIRSHYASALAHKLGGPAAQRSVDALKPLGPLRYVDDLTHRTRFTRDTLREIASPAAAAEVLAELLSKTVKVSFVAKFANGFAGVVIELKSEGGKMKLWHLQIDGQSPLPDGPRRAPQTISHA